MPLTDAQARSAKPSTRDYKLTDEKGLFLLVRANGSKLWRCKYRFAGREKLLSFGAYPEVGLSAARRERDEARTILATGRDPAIERKRREREAQRAIGETFEVITRRWHELNSPRWSERHNYDVLHSLERDVFPTLGSLPLLDIDAPLVLDVLSKVQQRGSIETAHRLRQRIEAVFTYAESLGLVQRNPAEKIGKALKPVSKKKRQPAVTDLAELREILRVTESSGAYPLTLLASRLLALTAVRPGVVRGAEWSEFHGIFQSKPIGEKSLHSGPYWHIPAARMKLALDRKDEASFDHIVPLPPAAVDVLEAARVLSGRGKLVFPGQRHAHRPLSENAIGYLYNRAGWHGRHVPHGWRAAFSTIMNERNPADRAIIDLMLAHTPENKVEAAYNRAEHMERRRELANEWADLLDLGPADELLGAARRLTTVAEAQAKVDAALKELSETLRQVDDFRDEL